MRKLPGDFLAIGRGAEYVFRGKDTVIVVSGGQVLTVATRMDKEKSSLVLIEGGEQSPRSETILFEGSASEIMQAFLDLSTRLTPRKRKGLLSIAQSLSVTAASLAIAVSLSLFVIETHSAFPPLETGVAAEVDELDPRQLPALPQPDVPTAEAAPAALKVLKRPDFLSTDLPTPSAPEPAAAEGMPAATPTIADTIARIGMPPLAQAAPEPAAKADPVAEPPAEDVAVKAIVGADVDPAPAKEPVSENMESSAPEAPVTEGEPSRPAQAKEANDPAIGKNAEAAVKKLIGDGMTEDQIRKLLVDLQALKNSAGEEGITPEMLQALPEEVAAALLADQGMDLKGPGGGTMNILPSEVVDRFRGKDGIATIPENYSWYARSGGPVSIPLPGGGDIKHPDDLVDFGLQP